MIVAGQMRAVRAVSGVYQHGLAEFAGLALQTIRRMQAGNPAIPDIKDFQAQFIGALSTACIELVGNGAVCTAARCAVRLAVTPPQP